MAEAAAEAPKKKGGKLPMIIALVATLGAGGFFGMKMAGGSKEPEKPKIELGHIEPMGEFLVNLSDGKTFLRTEISLHVAKDAHLAEGGGGDGHGGKAEPPAPVKDAIIAVLTGKSPADIESLEGKLKLKKEIAAAVNAVAPHHDEEHGEDHEEDKGKKKKKGHDDEEEHGKKGEKDGHDDEGHGDEEEGVVDETWDSQTGPVLKVYFTSFAAQQ